MTARTCLFDSTTGLVERVLGGHSWNTPTAINNHGVVIGFSLPLDQDGTLNYRAFVWTRESGVRKLDEMSGTIRSIAYGLNEDGQIVGVARITDAGRRAVMWETPIAAIQDLNELVPPGSPILTIAADVNNDGNIAGSIKEECLDRLIPFGERHFRRAVAEFVAHYQCERNHQGLGNELIELPPAHEPVGRIRRRSRLGGLLNYYARAE
jgi:hypothetical protein